MLDFSSLFIISSCRVQLLLAICFHTRPVQRTGLNWLRDMLPPTTIILVLAAILGEFAVAVPIQDSPRQRFLDGKPLPPKFLKKPPPPYTPEHRDPYDSAVDAIGEGLDPLPYRNGDGASVLGPWNRERARQNPDIVRPPSTDHGNMPNLRWSFADSHIRIEVRICPQLPSLPSLVVSFEKKKKKKS